MMNYVSADEAMGLVQSGDWVFFQGSTSVPIILQEALARHHERLRDVKIVSGFNVTKGVAAFCKPEYKESFVVNSQTPWFLSTPSDHQLPVWLLRSLEQIS